MVEVEKELNAGIIAVDEEVLRDTTANKGPDEWKWLYANGKKWNASIFYIRAKCSF